MILSFSDIGNLLGYSFVQYALVVCILISICSALIGVTLVQKHYSYLGDGLSHVAFGAMAIASVLNVTNNMWIIMPVTVLGAILLLQFGQNAKIKGDAMIAMASVSALAFGYLILNLFNTSSNLAGDVCSSLFGSTSLLTLTKKEVIVCVVFSFLLIATFVVLYNKIFMVTFDENYAKASGVKTKLYNIIIAIMIAVIIVISMRLVGSLLISALVIFPALSAMTICKNYKSVTLLSILIALVCSVCGMFLSMGMDTPVGATIVMVDLVVFSCFKLTSLVTKK